CSARSRSALVIRGARGMWAHGTEPPGCLAARTGPSVPTAGRDARCAGHGLLDSDGLPLGRDWRRRKRTDQLRDLVSC
ncbi:MAG: hypothetical protein ACRDQZ_19085, partial [Mycobacteriales bacterium]